MAKNQRKIMKIVSFNSLSSNPQSMILQSSSILGHYWKLKLADDDVQKGTEIYVVFRNCCISNNYFNIYMHIN